MFADMHSFQPRLLTLPPAFKGHSSIDDWAVSVEGLGIFRHHEDIFIDLSSCRIISLFEFTLDQGQITSVLRSDAEISANTDSPLTSRNSGVSRVRWGQLIVSGESPRSTYQLHGKTG